MKQQNLPLKLTETRQARLQRLLGGELRGKVAPASQFTFTPTARRQANQIAKGQQ